MIKTLKNYDVNELEEEIYALQQKGHVLHLKAGSAAHNSTDWYNYLSSLSFLSPDRRHFDEGNKLNERDWWEIKYDPTNEHTYAYSKTAQPFHTDNAWFANPPEINFFFLQKQAKSGGQQRIYPIQRLIDDLNYYEPGLLNDLTQVEVVIRKGEELKGHKTRILNRLKNGTYKIYWNYYRVIRSSDAIDNMCNAFFRFLDSQINSSSVESIPSETGDAFCFNDSLLLHARDAFEAHHKGDRILLQSMWSISER
ncbi:TauD/TfdA family dioxygenase [Alteromonas sp. ASW11-130]|uniref:TauD/TfdA family dioxygenase n=1 Tax=Alteromonas sp. ASW11-130 TaxID=3015775 RepID=UPI0022426970|nr:TauD/TfdA family dioxygenase [Alteromonas sp. ASW11-130]MCW8090349.1 TauD/TfdA family dioxygenase [Alteromonas sp. ASW11-130]